MFTTLRRFSPREIAAWALSFLVALVISALMPERPDGVLLADNTLLTITMITRESLRVLRNKLAFTKRIRRTYDDKFAVEGAKIGAVCNVRKPPKYEIRTGDAMQLQDAKEEFVPVTLDQLKGIDLEFGDVDLKLSIDDFSKRFISPAVAKIANEIDRQGLLLYKKLYHAVGTPGTTPTELATYLDAGVKLNNSSAPPDEWAMVINARMQATIVDALKGLFQQAAAIADQYRRGIMGEAVGFMWYMDQNVAVHTNGPRGGTPAVAGADQTGASLDVDGFTATAALRLREGDVFTLPDVYGVNSLSGESTGELQQFVVQADVFSDGAGAATIPIDPPLIATGAYKTVTELPANGAVLTFEGAAGAVTPQGLAFHPDFATFVSADLEVPRGVDMAGRLADDELGISIRIVRAYDIRTNRRPVRLDVLFGWSVMRPELGVRVAA